MPLRDMDREQMWLPSPRPSVSFGGFGLRLMMAIVRIRGRHWRTIRVLVPGAVVLSLCLFLSVALAPGAFFTASYSVPVNVVLRLPVVLADVNGDGIVDHEDLLRVAYSFGESSAIDEEAKASLAPPSCWRPV